MILDANHKSWVNSRPEDIQILALVLQMPHLEQVIGAGLLFDNVAHFRFLAGA